MCIEYLPAFRLESFKRGLPGPKNYFLLRRDLRYFQLGLGGVRGRAPEPSSITYVTIPWTNRLHLLKLEFSPIYLDFRTYSTGS